RQREQRQALAAEHFQPQEDGRQRAVGASTEQRHHAQRGAQRRGQPQQRRHGADEGGPGEENGYDLAALVPGAQRQGCEQHFQRKSPGLGLSGNGGGDDGAAGAVVVGGAQQQGQGYDQDAAHGNAQIGVGQIPCV